jgi:chromosomal replication initiator protein
MQVKPEEQKLWDAVLAEMQVTLSELEFGAWFKNTHIKTASDANVEVACPSTFAADTLKKKYHSLIQNSFTKIGKKPYEVTFVVAPKTILEQEPSGPLFQDEQVNSMPPETRLGRTPAFNNISLNPRATFENYVMGSNNRLAYSIATAVADNPGRLYNPFFIYSNVGLGKTHLMQAIGNRILQKNPTAKVHYCTSEDFTNELIEAVQSGKTKGKYTSNKFREKYRNVDVLLIDDIQFIAKKESTQEEFFHTFNALHMAQKQIVVTSDRPPKDFTNIEERITSRLGMGIIADIQSPDVETRIAILRNKRDKTGDEVSNEIIDFIAENVTTNIRELEGAYLQVLTYSRATGQDLTLKTAAESLGQSIKLQAAKPLNVNQILKIVSSYFNVTLSDIKGQRRKKEFVVPRQMAMYLLYELTQTPFVTIGELLGNRDHTTIMHGVKKIETELKSLGKTKQDYLNIKQVLKTD